jgi:hypothetical protein
MPQLDKYIFFNQIVYLTIFFFLIYINIRGTVVPKISILLKYRKKKINLLNIQIERYNKILNFAKFIFDKNGKNYALFLVKRLNIIGFSYFNRVTFQFQFLYNTILHIFEEPKFFFFLSRTKLELNRLNNYVR